MRSRGYVHPEWGYLAPAPRFLRTARTALLSTFIGGVAGAAVVFSLVQRPAADHETMVEPSVTAVPDVTAHAAALPAAQPLSAVADTEPALDAPKNAEPFAPAPLPAVSPAVDARATPTVVAAPATESNEITHDADTTPAAQNPPAQPRVNVARQRKKTGHAVVDRRQDDNYRDFYGSYASRRQDRYQAYYDYYPPPGNTYAQPSYSPYRQW